MPSTRYPNGVTNVTQQKTLGEMPVFDNTSTVRYFDDFCLETDILAASPLAHTVTKVGAGTIAPYTQSGGGGWLLFTNAAADDNSISVQHKSESFKYVAGKAWSIKAKVALDDVTQSDLMLGVAITDTTPLDATDYIAFMKVDGAATISLVLCKNSTTTTVGSATLTNSVNVVLGARYVPKKKAVEFLVNEVVVASTTTLTNLCDDEELAMTLHWQNGEAVAKNLTADYLDICFER